MPIVQSFGALQAMTDRRPTFSGASSGGALNLYGLSQAYYEIYKSQPNVRICVDFLARNIAQLGLPVFRRISDTDRERLPGHDLAKWLANPNPATTRYRLIEDLMTDLGIYFRAYWLKVRYQAADGRDALGLVRLPPDEVTVKGAVMPTAFIWTVDGREQPFAPSEIVHFAGYRLGVSPLETLRRILAEEQAAGSYRESLWSHGAKHEGIWERAADAPNWTPEQRNSWRDQWQEFASNSKAGMTAVGEKGMKYVPTSFSSKDSEYVAGGKLRREICAAAYHIPQPMVGILEHATFSNIRAQHEHLYQDTLGPWNEMIVQEIERQLLIECDDQDSVYLEFNIDAKLAGTPQDRASSLQMAVGRPWRTPNEARALENLPRIDNPEFDTLAPQQGGPAAAQSTAAPTVRGDDGDNALVAAAIEHTQRRIGAKLAKVEAGERAAVFIAGCARWQRELSADLAVLVGADEADRRSAQVMAAAGKRLASEDSSDV